MTDISNKELFIRWYAWSLEYKDCDPAVWMTNYLNERYEYNDEERIWLCWLYGNTYNLPTAWVLKNEFPDFELVSQSRIEDWNSKNYSRLRYQTDTKWNKGHLPAMFASYKSFFGHNSQRSVFESNYGDNEFQNFNNIWDMVKSNFHKFGRYGTWFYLQHLKHTANIIMEPTSLMLNDHGGSKSHRNGLLYALDMQDLIDQKLDESQYRNLESMSIDIINECKSRFSSLASDFDFFTMETALCAFKKIFRLSKSRYLGYYLDRQAEEILKAETDGWVGIEWNVLWQARKESLDSRLVRKTGVDNNKFSFFSRTGKIEHMSWMFGQGPELSLEGLM